MNHRSLRKQLSAYVDHELAEEHMESIRKHVDGCAACKQVLQELQSIRSQIREAATAELPDNFIFYVRSAIRREESESVAWLGSERLARNIVVVLCILVLSIFAFESYLEPQQSIGVERFFTAETSDSTAQRVLGSQQELSKADVLMAALNR